MKALLDGGRMVCDLWKTSQPECCCKGVAKLFPGSSICQELDFSVQANTSFHNIILNRAANIVIASHRRRRCDAANRIGGLDAMAMLRCRIDDHRSRPVDLAGAVSVDIRANPLVVTLRRLDRLGAEGHSLW